MFQKAKFLLQEAVSIAKTICAGEQGPHLPPSGFENSVHYQLESRVMMSASPVAIVAETPDGSFEEAALPAEPSEESKSSNEISNPEEAANTPSVEPDAADTENSVSVESREIVIIDADVAFADQLLADIEAQRVTGRAIEAYLLDGSRDGIQQISEILANHSDLESIHLVSHGAAGQIRLGSTLLSVENLAGYAGEVAGWNSSLATGADLLIYGCDLASSEDGRALTEALGSLCDCDVAASDDATGHDQLGGDWDLEYAQGVIDTQIAFSEGIWNNWFSVLDVAAFQQGTGGYAGTLDTEIEASAPDTTNGSNAEIEVGGSSNRQALIRFEDLVGGGSGQIPVGSTINSATLTLDVNNATLTGNIDLHRLLTGWDESSTWNSLSGGISLDDVEAESTREERLNNPDQMGPQVFFDLVSTVQDWADGKPNYGWVIVNNDSDSWRFATSEDGTVGNRPMLTVDYTAPGVETPLRVNAQVSDIQQSAETGGSATARSNNGNSVAVWSSKKQDNGNEGRFGIYAQLYDEGGARISGEILVNTYVAKDQMNASVAMDDAGNFVVTWQSDDQDGDGFGVYMQRFDASGAKLGVETRVNTETTSDQTNPAISMDNDGDFVIVWQSDSQDGDGWGVYGQRFNVSGAKVGEEFLVTTSTSFDQYDPSVALSDNGQFVVTWTADSVFGGDGLEVFGQRFDADGNADGLEFWINDYVTKDQFDSSVSMDDAGNFVVVWTSDGQDGDRFGIYGRTFNSSGSPRSSEFLIPTNTLKEQQHADVAMRDDGDFVVSWTHLDSNQIFYRYFNLDGVPQASVSVVDTITTTNQRFSAIGFDDAGRHTLVWSGDYTHDDAGVFVKLYDASANEKPTIVLPGSAINYAESDPATILDATATLSDIDSADFNGGSLTVEFSFGGTVNDRLAIRNEGTGSGQIGVSGSVVTFEGLNIGTFAGGTSGLSPLVISLNANADIAATQALARNITYWNVSDGPSTDARNVRMYLADGDGGVSLAADKGINVTIVNDSPVISGPGSQSTPEDNSISFEPGNGNAITIADPDIDLEALHVTLTVSHGELDLGATNNLTFQIGDGSADTVMAFTGTLADVNDALDGLTFTPPQLFVGTANLTIVVDDQGSSGAGGPQVDSLVIPISVTSDGSNDAPNIIKPGNQSGVEDQPLFFSINNANQLVLEDDAGANQVEVTLSVANGTLTLGGTSGLSFSAGDGSADASMVFRGTIEAANAALEGMYFQPNLGFVGTVMLNVDVNDLGNSDGNPADPETDNDSIRIDVEARNRAPEITAPTTATTIEGVPLVFSGVDLISFSDVDAGTQNLQVMLTATHGTMTLSSLAGLTFTNGDGISDTSMTFRGRLTDINLAVAGMNFTPKSGFAGAALLQVSVNDLGNTGAGGALVDQLAVNIDITPDATNAPPINTVPGAQTTAEETPIVFSTNDGNAISINDDSGVGDITVTLTATGGKITLSSTTGDEFLVNTDISGDQEDVQTAMTPDGRLVMVWTSAGLDGSGDGVYAQLIDASGTPEGGEFRVNTTTANHQHEPSVAVDDNGNFVVVWTSDGQDGSSQAVIAQRFDAGGNKLGSEFLVNSATSSEQRNASVAMDADGDFVIVWQSLNQDGSGWGVYGKRYDAAGNPLDVPAGPPGVKEFRINSTTIDQQLNPVVAMDDAGNFAIAWQSANQDGDDFGIFAKRYDAAGNALDSPLTPPGTPEFQVNTVFFKDQQSPAIAMDDNGNFVIAWQSEKQDHTSGKEHAWGVYAQRYDAAGNLQGVNFLVNSKITDEQSMPAVAMAGDGEFVIAWQGDKQDNPDGKSGVFAQRYDAAGTEVEVEFLVNSTTVKDQQSPAVAMGDDGHFVIAWQSDDQDGSEWGVYAQRYRDIRSLTFLVGDGADDAVVQFQGTVDQINDALDGLIFTPTANFVGSANLHLLTDDGSLTDDDDINISVTPVNDAPTVLAPTAVSVNEAASITFSTGNGNQITIGDVDIVSSEPVRVTLMTTHGTLTLNGTTGLSFSDGDGTDDAAMTFTGTLANVNAALQGARFDTPIGFVGGGSIQINVDDQGNVGSGPALSASATVEIAFDADSVNDAPVISTPPPQQTDVNTPLVLDVASGNAPLITDDSGSNPVAVTVNVTGGKISLSQLVSEEFQVNSFTTDNQQFAAVATSPTGQYVVVWQGENQDGSGLGIYAQRYNAYGQVSGSEFQVNTTTISDQQLPVVAMNATGQFAIAWQSANQDGNGQGIYTRLFDADGIALSNETLVNSYTQGEQSQPAIAMSDAGNYVVAWESGGQDGDQTGVFAKRFDSAGIAIGNEFRVNTVTAGHQHDPAVAMDSDGDFIIVWTGKDPSGEGILAQRYLADGTPDGSEFLVNTVVLNNQSAPDVGMDAAGNFVVVWQSAIEDGSGETIVGRRYNNSGVPQGANFIINTETVGDQTAPQVDMNASGEFFVVWQDTDGTGQGVFGQRFAATGVAVGGQIGLNTAKIGDQDAAHVALNDNGNAVVVWTGGNAQDGDTDGVFGQLLADFGGLVFTSGDGINDASMVFTGTVDDVNNAIAGMTFTPTTSFTGVASINFIVDDQGHTGSGGPQVSSENMYVIVGGAALIVDTTSDVVDGNTGSIVNLNSNKGVDGKISLREAILAANNTANGDTPDVILFDLPNSDANHLYYRDDGIADSLSIVATTTLSDANISDFDPDYAYAAHSWFRIDLNSALPELEITDAVVLDGYSQLGASANTLNVGNNAKLRIELTSSGADSHRGLTVLDGGDESLIRGLAINGFDFSEIMVEPGADGVKVQGNFVGTDITGSLPLGDGDSGVQLRSNNNLVGGPAAGDRNIISGNNGRGVVTFTSGPIATGNVVQNNYIGTDAAGTTSVANGTAGVQVYNQDGFLILDNVISGNSGDGIWLRESTSVANTVIQGNLIGVAADGVSSLANTGAGIWIEEAATATNVGGVLAGQANIVAFNTGDGIAVDAGSGTSVRGNKIFSNGGLGIDLNGVDGVDANDAGDGDTGTNDLQNFPVLVGGAVNGSDLTISGTLNSSANSTFQIDFYSSDNADGSGHGEAERYLGSTTILTDGSGHATINELLSGVGVLTGQFVTATATDSSGNTSEFALSLTASQFANLAAVADTYLDNDNPTDNFGASTSLIVDRSGGGIGNGRALLQFDLSGMPTGATIVSATLRLNATNNSSAFDLNIYEVIESWSEGAGAGSPGESNWTERDAANSWTTDGGEFDATVVATLNTGSVGLHLWDITTLVNAWYTGASANHGLIIGSPDLGTTTVTYDSREGSIPPELQILYVGGSFAPDIINLAGDTLAYIEDEPALLIAQGTDISVNDADSADFDSGELTVSVAAGGDPSEDQLSIRNQGMGAGQIGFDGGSVFYGGTLIGTATGGSGGVDLVVTFNANADTAASEALLENITYKNIDTSNPSTSDRTIRFTLSDGDGGSSSSYDATVTIALANDAPLLDSAGNMALTAIDEDNFTSSGDTVSAIIASAGGDRITDADLTPLEGIAVVGVDDTNGTWQYDAGSGWTAFGSVSNSSAVLLDPTAKIRFMPNSNYNGSAGNVTFRGWDQTDGNSSGDTGVDVSINGGQTAYSANAELASLNVTPINDSPILNDFPTLALDDNVKNAGPPVGAVGTLVSSLVDFDQPAGGRDNVSDPDAGASTGIAIASTNTDNGTWFFTVDGGSTWSSMGSLNPNDARLLAADALTRIYFQPNLGFSGTVGNAIKFHAWDQFNGVNGSLADTNPSGGTSGFSTNFDFVDITVLASNAAPTIVSNGGGPTATINVSENSTAVTTVVAADTDFPAQLLTYSISGGDDAAKFSIGSASGLLSFVTPPDFELPADSNGDNTYELTVLVSDGEGGTDSQNIVVNVTPVNDNAPVVAVGQSFSLSEFAANGTTVGTVMATDADAGTTFSGWTITSGNAAGLFSINALTGHISVADNSSLDFETISNYLLEVAVSDGANTSAAQSVTITVGNENDPTLGAIVIAGTPQEDQVLTADISGVTDQDGISTVGYQWFRNGVAISGATSSTYTLGDTDVGSIMRVHMMVVDGLGNTVGPLASADTPPIANVNDAPLGLPILVGVWEENQTVFVDDSSITDADGLGVFSYQWLRGGVSVAGANSANYELTDDDIGQFISVRVTYTDGQGTLESVTSAVAGPVGDVNAPPTLVLTPLISNLDENVNTASSIKVADISVIDDAVGTNNLRLVGSDAGLFELRSGGTELHLRAGANLNFEAKSTLNVVVQLDDPTLPGNPEDSAAYSLAINDVNEEPRLAISQVANFVLEQSNDTSAVVVANFAVIDDALGVNAVFLSGADAAFFEISGNHLKLKAGVALEDLKDLAVILNVDDAMLNGVPEDSKILRLDVVSGAALALPATNAPSAVSGEKPASEETSQETEKAKPATPVQLLASAESPIDPTNPNVEGGDNSDDLIGVLMLGHDADSDLSKDAEESQQLESSESNGRRRIEAGNLTDWRSSNAVDAYRAVSFNSISQDGLFWQQLDSFQDTVNTQTSFDSVVMGSFGALSGSVTAGYVIWMVRGGVVASTLLAQLPAWKYLDAMTILANFEEHDDDDAESLQTIVDQDLDDDESLRQFLNGTDIHRASQGHSEIQ